LTTATKNCPEPDKNQPLSKAPIQSLPLKLLGCTLPFDKVKEYASIFETYGLRPEILLTSSQALSPDKDTLAFAKELCARTGGCTVHAPFVSMFWNDRDDAMESNAMIVLCHGAEVASELKADSAVIHTNWDPRTEPSLDNWLKACCKQLCKVAEYYIELGVRPLIENVREDSPEKLIRIRAELPDETGICIDPGHSAVMSPFPAIHWLEKVKPWLSEIHMHNNNKKSDEHLPVSEGTAWDVKKVLVELVENEYNFYPVLEPKDKDTAVKSLQALTAWNFR
jgi:sugar phosphate isomerase/epimerase